MAAFTDDDRIGGGASNGSDEQWVSAVMIPSGALPQDAQPPTANVATAGPQGDRMGVLPNAGELACRGPWHRTASNEMMPWQASRHCAHSSMSSEELSMRPFLDHHASASFCVDVLNSCAFSWQESTGIGPNTYRACSRGVFSGRELRQAYASAARSFP